MTIVSRPGKRLEISPQFFDDLKNFAIDFSYDTKKVRYAIDKIMMGYSIVTVAAAQKRSQGMLDPRAKRGGALGQVRGTVRTSTGIFSAPSQPSDPYSHSEAWKIPVRRITERYYRGWYRRQVHMGTWMVTNTSREAYFIEFGINHVGTGLAGPNGQRVRIRRPILKLSVIEALAFVHGSKMDARMIYANYAHSFTQYHSPHLLPHVQAFSKGGGSY